jgi:hypothetical protein
LFERITPIASRLPTIDFSVCPRLRVATVSATPPEVRRQLILSVRLDFGLVFTRTRRRSSSDALPIAAGMVSGPQRAAAAPALSFAAQA